MKKNKNLPHIQSKLESLGKVRVADGAEADFIVEPRDGGKPLQVQVWSAAEFAEVNRTRKNIHIAFCVNEVYCYPHNDLLEEFFRKGNIRNSKVWQQLGHYRITPKSVVGETRDMLAPYRIYPCEPKP